MEGNENNVNVTQPKFKCSYCNKPFDNLSILQRHERVHTGEKPYKCPICGKGFTQQGNVTKHLKTHQQAEQISSTTENPFKCPVFKCTESFTAKDSLSTHMASFHDNATLEDYLPNLLDFNPHHHHDDNYDQYTAKKRCLHSGCDAAFDTQQELRDHLHDLTPSLIVENDFLTKTIVQFADSILEWDSKSLIERNALKMYAMSVKESVQLMSSSNTPLPLHASTDTINTTMQHLNVSDSSEVLLNQPQLEQQQQATLHPPPLASVFSFEEAVFLSQTLMGSGVPKPHVVINPCHTAQHFQTWQFDDFNNVPPFLQNEGNQRQEGNEDNEISSDNDNDVAERGKKRLSKSNDAVESVSDIVGSYQNGGQSNSNCSLHKRHRS